MKYKNLRTHVFPPENHIIGSRLLKQNSILIIGGPPKSMKSMVAAGISVDLCCARPLWSATHRSKLGMEFTFPVSRPHRVLIIEMEIGEEDCQERLNAMWKSLNPQEQELMDENLEVESCKRSLRLHTTDGYQQVEKVVQRAKPDVIILDPLVEFLGDLDENSSKDMGKFLDNIDSLRDRYHVAVILIHHCGKPDKNGGIVDFDSPDALRGSSRLRGKYDSALMLHTDRHMPGFVTITPELRRGRPLDPFSIKIDGDTLMGSFRGWSNEPKYQYGSTTSKQAN